MASRTDALSDYRDGSHAYDRTGKVGKAVDVVHDGIDRDGSGPEGCDQGLNENLSDVEHGVFDSAGKPNPQNSLYHGRNNLNGEKLFYVYVQAPVRKNREHNQGTHYPGGKGCDSRTHAAQMEDEDQDSIA